MATSKKPLQLLARAKETTPPSTRTGGRLFDELASLNAVSDALLIPVQNPVDGMNYRMTYGQIKAGVVASKAYGLLYTEDGDTASPQASQTATGTMALMSTWQTDGAAFGTTPDYTAGKITVAAAGIYQVSMAISFSGSLSSTYECEIYQDDITASPTPTETGLKLTRKLGTGGDVGSASLIGLVSLSAGDSIMVYMRSTDGGTAFLVYNAQLLVTQV